MAVQGASNFYTTLQKYGVGELPTYPSCYPTPSSEKVIAWEFIKKHLHGDQGIRNIMLNIEQKYEFFYRGVKTSLDQKTSAFFAALETILTPECDAWNIPLKGREPLDYCVELQTIRNKKADVNLDRAWHKRTGLLRQVQEMGAFFKTKPPMDPPPIREWILRDEGKGYLARITKLDLGELSLSVFPKEISYCKTLKDLQLNHNNFISFPYNLNTWPDLEICNLSKNRLEFFLDNETSHPNLKKLDLSFNRFQSLSYNFNGYSKLECLYLQGNPFESLSCDLNGCVKLTELALTTEGVKKFNFKLPFLRLLQGPIASMFSCDFSFPALRATSSVSMPLNCRLGVFFCVPLPNSHYPTMKIYPFNQKGDLWTGMIPLMKQFKFACLGSDGNIKEENRQGWRCVGLQSWRKTMSFINFADVSFAISPLVQLDKSLQSNF